MALKSLDSDSFRQRVCPAAQLTFNAANNQNAGNLYDAVGNVRQDGSHSYLYDGEGRMCGVVTSLTGDALLTVYTYDAEGHRVAKASRSLGPTDPRSCRTDQADQNGNPLLTPSAAYIAGPNGSVDTELDGGGN